MNASAAFQVGLTLGIEPEIIKKSLMSYQGIGRRFERIGSFQGAEVYSDFAHHPTEIKAQLAAVREWFPKHRIIVVFQPHTYSRTKALLSEFAKSFGNAHEVILTEIYSSARETDTLGISGKTLVEETAKHHPSVYFAPNFAAVKKLLTKHMRTGDVIIFLGAGSIYTWAKKLISE